MTPWHQPKDHVTSNPLKQVDTQQSTEISSVGLRQAQTDEPTSYNRYISRLTAPPFKSMPWTPLAITNGSGLSRKSGLPTCSLPSPPGSTRSSPNVQDPHHVSLAQGQQLAFTEPHPDPLLIGLEPRVLAQIPHPKQLEICGLERSLTKPPVNLNNTLCLWNWPEKSQSRGMIMSSADELSFFQQLPEGLSPRSSPSVSPCSNLSSESADSGYLSDSFRGPTVAPIRRARKRLQGSMKEPVCIGNPGTSAPSRRGLTSRATSSGNATSGPGLSVVGEAPPLVRRASEGEVSEATTTQRIALREADKDDKLEDNEETPESEVPSPGSRSPSPWQAANSPDSEQALVQSLWWIVNGANSDTIQNQTSTTSTPVSSRSDSPVVNPLEGVHAHAQATSGSGESPASQPAPSSNASAGSTGGSGGSEAPKRARDSDDPTKSPEDGDDEGPNRKRFKPAGSEMPLLRPRFACPYQKYDPLGSPFCCKPGYNNPEGGADTFPRIKSHIFRNHDPFIRCPNCWKSCKTEEEALQHEHTVKCIRKASPAKYWMTREQRDEIRGRKFMASTGADNWFCLFGILIPSVTEEECRKLSPYYISMPSGPLTPSPSLTGSANRRISATSQPFLLDAEPPSLTATTQQVQLGPRPFAYHAGFIDPFQRQQQRIPNPSPNPQFNLFPDFIGFDSDGDVDSRILNWDLAEPSQQPQNSSNLAIPTSFPTVSGPVTQNLPTPPGYTAVPSHSPFHDDQSEQPLQQQLQPFLRQDNERLRATNSSLQDENDAYRKRQAEHDAQLNNLRDQLRPLENAVQDLLYLPGVRGGEDGLVDQLFKILEGLDGMRKTLISAQT